MRDNGERTDRIAARLGDALAGADALVVQGGINDVVQRVPVAGTLANLHEMVRRGLDAGLRVALANVLPWLEDRTRPGTMRAGWTAEGDHPSLAGYRRLGELAFRKF